MKIWKITIYTCIACIVLYLFKSHFSVQNFDQFYRNLQTNTNMTNITQDNITKNVTNSYENLNCSSLSYNTEWSDDDKTNALEIFNIIFQKNEELSEKIRDIFASKEGFSNLSISDPRINYIIYILIKLLIPVILLLFFSLIGWFTCCSCCCYEYCPIFCKKDDNFEYSTTSKLTPVILVLFSGLSLIIPIVMYSITAANLKNSLKTSYCQVLNIAYITIL
jgi:hypothetical protein